MTSLVLDTHTIIWYLDDSSQLSQTAESAIRDAIAGGFPMYVSAISVIEIRYLIEKHRLTDDQLTNLISLLRNPNSGFQLVVVDLAIAESMSQLSRAAVPDMPDRIISSTAIQLELPLVTADAGLQASVVPTIWK